MDCPACRASVPAESTECPACAAPLPAADAAPPVVEATAPAVLDVPAPVGAVSGAPSSSGQVGSVSERLRALGRPLRDRSDESDTVYGHPPLRDDSPLPEVAPRAPQGPAPPLPPIFPVRISWLLIVALALACWLTGAFSHGGLSETRLAEVGGLVARRWDEPWRLVTATFVHQFWFLALITAFMLWVFGGEVERRTGSGVVLFVVVALGAGLNAARLAGEPPAALFYLAGGWPAGLALGGVALALSVLAPAPGTRRPFHVVTMLGLETTIVIAVAHHGNVLAAGLQAVVFLSIGAGLVLGLVLALSRGFGRGGGCLLGGLAVAALLAAHAERELGRGSARPPWEPPPAIAIEDLRTSTFEDLKLRLDHPDWTEREATCRVTCPACKREVEVPATKGKATGTVACPRCGGDGVRPKARVVVDYDEPPFQRRRLRVVSFPKGPYDAADTLAAVEGASMARRERGWRDLLDVAPVADRALAADPGWLRESGWSSAWVLVVRCRFANLGPTIVRQYFLVGKLRTVQLIALEADDGTTHPEQTPGAALFDAVARSARELP